MQNFVKDKITIKSWAAEDRPREKMINKGKKELTDVELLSILLGSGNREETAVGLSRRILMSVDNDLNELGSKTLGELKQFKGIGEAKAICISAALELGRRRQLIRLRDRPQILSSEDAFRVVAPLLIDLPHEEFWILLLNRANRVVGRERISSGGIAGTVVDPKVVFRTALKFAACSIVLAHNHPSGNLQPSQADIQLTAKLVRAGTNLDITVLDHLIVSERGYRSLADEGEM